MFSICGVYRNHGDKPYLELIYRNFLCIIGFVLISGSVYRIIFGSSKNEAEVTQFGSEDQDRNFDRFKEIPRLYQFLLVSFDFLSDIFSGLATAMIARIVFLKFVH
jgi:hypothetical protein